MFDSKKKNRSMIGLPKIITRSELTTIILQTTYIFEKVNKVPDT